MQNEAKRLSELVNMMQSKVVEKTELPDFAGRTLEELKKDAELPDDWKQFFAWYTLKMEEEKKILLERLLDPSIKPWW